MSPALKQSTFRGVAAKWCAPSRLSCYHLYSEAVLAIKNSRKVFMIAFYKTDSWILKFSELWLSYISYKLALDYVLSYIVPFFGVRISSSKIVLNER